jgi:tRNA (adenine22-N1)-methyltransferase
MNQELKLTPRLQTIFNSLMLGKPVWDLCCDHGYLGLRCYLSKQFPEVHFVDQVEEIITSLEVKFRENYSDIQNPTKISFIAMAGEKLTSPASVPEPISQLLPR